MATYRTKTYIAGDWTGDSDAIELIYKWKESDYLGLDFVDAHDLTQARDTSLPCSIKASLKKRLDVSKTFVLIVGNDTKKLTKGSCAYCQSYHPRGHYCARGHSISMESFIEYECKIAFEDNLKIVVLYNSLVVNKEKCPSVLRNVGVHLPMILIREGMYKWNYCQIKNSIMD